MVADNKNILLQGKLSEKSLIELLRFCEEKEITGSIQLNKNEERGFINLKDGKIQTVSYEQIVDKNALNELIQWSTGDFIVSSEPVLLKKHKVLAVNSEEKSERIKELLADRYDVIYAPTVEDALKILERQEDWSDILFADLSSLGAKALELIVEAKNKNPQLHIGVATDSGLPQIPQRRLNQSTLCFIENPLTKEALLQAFTSRCEFDSKEEYFLEVMDITYLLHLTRQSAILEITSHAQEIGSIYFSDGEVIRAQLNDLSGIKAFEEILTWESGRFSIIFVSPEVSQDINLPFERLVTVLG